MLRRVLLSICFSRLWRCSCKLRVTTDPEWASSYTHSRTSSNNSAYSLHVLRLSPASEISVSSIMTFFRWYSPWIISTGFLLFLQSLLISAFYLLKFSKSEWILLTNLADPCVLSTFILTYDCTLLRAEKSWVIVLRRAESPRKSLLGNSWRTILEGKGWCWDWEWS